MNIDIVKLQRIVNMLCDRCIELNGPYLNSSEDYFWHLTAEDATDFQKVPSEFCVGSLEEDYSALEELLAGRVINILDLERIANIFGLIAFETEQQKEKWF